MRILLTLAAIAVAAAACTGNKKDDPSGTALTSDMAGAVSIALMKPVAPAFTTAAFAGTAGEPFFSLVRIDANGNVDPVFSQERPIHWVEVTETHVAVSGLFDDVSAIVDEGEPPQSVNCRLVTFSRVASGEPVKCIASFTPGFPNNDPMQTEGVPLDYPGFAAADTTVYLTDGGGGAGIPTRAWKWAGGSDVIELLLELQAPLALAQVFAAEGGNHVCAMSLADGHPNGEESLYCTPLASISWMPVAKDPAGFPNMRGLVVGSSLVTGFSRVNLVDGTQTAMGTNRLPSGRNHTILVGTTAWGLSVGIGQAGGDIVRVTPEGGTTIDASVDWERIAGTGAAAYVYGASQLRRLDFASASLGTNLLGATTLLQVTDLSLSMLPNIRIDGTTSAGTPAVVLVNTSSGEITVTQEDVPRFQSVTPLQ